MPPTLWTAPLALLLKEANVETRRLESALPQHGQVAGSSDLDMLLSKSNLCEHFEHLYSYSGTPSTSLCYHKNGDFPFVLYTTVFRGVKFV